MNKNLYLLIIQGIEDGGMSSDKKNIEFLLKIIKIQ